MKLLTKSEITTLKAKDQKQAIDEGIKLTRRVESLREIQAQEEASLKQFREKTIKEIQEEIKREIKPLEDLKKEVEFLKEEREKALKPLYHELEELSRSREEIQKEFRDLGVQRLEVEKSQESAQENLKNSLDEFSRAAEERGRSIELLQDADLKSQQATQLVKESENIKYKSEVLARNIQEEFQKRDSQIASKERNLTLRDEHQKSRELELNTRETKLNDRERMFQRTLKRKL